MDPSAIRSGNFASFFRKPAAATPSPAAVPAVPSPVVAPPPAPVLQAVVPAPAPAAPPVPAAVPAAAPPQRTVVVLDSSLISISDDEAPVVAVAPVDTRFVR